MLLKLELTSSRGQFGFLLLDGDELSSARLVQALLRVRQLLFQVGYL